MSTLAPTIQPASSLKQLVARHPVAAFLVMLFAVTYALVLVGLFHSTYNTTVNRFAGGFIPGPAESGFLIASGVVAVSAVLLVIITRGRLSYQPNPPHV